MKEFRAKKAALAAAVFGFGTMGTIELPKDGGISHRLIHTGVTISLSTAAANEGGGPIRRASCTLIRYYVARYSAPAAEAWARSKGATDAEIDTARRCITPQRAVQASHIVE
jgi:hypothetical protein